MANPQRAVPAKRAKRTPQQRLLGFFKWLLVVVLSLSLLGLGAFAVAYSRTTVPDPNRDFQTNVSTVMFRDGTTKLGSFAVQNRVSLSYAEIPQNVKDALVASENDTFWTDPGISVAGLARAVISALGPGDTVGGSTITQQYVKVLYLSQDKTLTRKLKEILVALKINRDLPKEQILEGYLNTVYFGRGAYGIQTAAQAFFGVDAKNLTDAQAIALVSMINDPGRLDPLQGDKQRANLLERYQYTINQLVKTGKMTEAEKATLYTTLPDFPKLARDSRFAGPNGFLLRMVSDELKAAGFDDAQINGGGYTIVTTVDPTMQDAAIATAQAQMAKAASERKKDPAGLNAAIASVDVATGGVLALYGGRDFVENNRNWATTIRPTGSTFKTWAVVAALRSGITLSDTFAGRTLLSATTNSSNESFLELTAKMKNGPEKIVQAAIDAGLPKTNFDPQSSIALGYSEVSPLNAAAGYATLANEGKQVRPFIVNEVRDAKGTLIFKKTVTQPQTIEVDVANDTTYALTHVASEGTGKVVAALGYPVAGKTGTRYLDAKTGTTASWFVGYTKQISTAVMFVAGDDGNGNLDTFSQGFYGSGYPASTWLAFMKTAQKGLPKLEFPAPTKRVSTQRPVITATPTASDTPTATPDPTPGETPDPEPTRPAPTSPQPSSARPTRPTPTIPGRPTPTNGG